MTALLWVSIRREKRGSLLLNLTTAFTMLKMFSSATAASAAAVAAPSCSPLDRKKAALLGLYIADAVAMPTH